MVCNTVLISLGQKLTGPKVDGPKVVIVDGTSHKGCWAHLQRQKKRHTSRNRLARLPLARRVRLDSRGGWGCHIVASTRLQYPELRHVSRFKHHVPGEHAERQEAGVHAGHYLLELEQCTHSSAGAAYTASAGTTRLTSGAGETFSTTGTGTVKQQELRIFIPQQ